MTIKVYPGLLLEEREGVAVITLKRPEKLNALSTQVLESLIEALGEAAELGLPVLLTGEGRVFSAGIDLAEVAGASSETEASQPFRALVRAIGALLDYPHPTLSYLNGPAIAGGGELALATDILIMAPGSRLEWPEVRWNIIPPLLLALAEKTGLPRLAHAALTGARITAEDALAMGLAGMIAGWEDALEHAASVAKLYNGNKSAFQAMLPRVRAWKRSALDGAQDLVGLAASMELVERARRFLGSRG